jgi:thiol-disulfide isomerase/thioredoxin
MKPSRISLVYANWCPHCYPLSVEQTEKMSEELGVPLRLLDIDKPEDVGIGDELVKRYGDDSEDYLIPQVFLEFPEGRVQHIFTGFSEHSEITKKHWDDFFSSEFYATLKHNN